MNNINQFDWVDFYNEFAHVLLKYKNNRSELVEKVKEIYDVTGIKMPKLDNDDSFTDIDPFTVFGLFNKNLTEENRRKILSAISDLFDVKSNVPTSFDSIPVLDARNATYYLFSNERGETDIDDLWELFDVSLKYANSNDGKDRNNLEHYFDITVNLKWNGTSKITMGLYWIAPDKFINLDSRNEEYIYKSGKIPFEVVDQLPKLKNKMSGSDYMDIVAVLKEYINSSECELKDFKDLSYEAWLYTANLPANPLPDDVKDINYWVYAPGEKASLWNECFSKGIMLIGWSEIGNFKNFKSRNDIKSALDDTLGNDSKHTNDSLATWEFCNVLKPGDIVFVKNGTKEILGMGEVSSDYRYDDSREDTFKNLRDIKWLNVGSKKVDFKLPIKTLTNVTKDNDTLSKLKSLYEDKVNVDNGNGSYGKQKFLEEVYMDSKKYDKLVSVLQRKKNIVLQGAPGVGKTYCAKRLAYSMMGEKNDKRIEFVQFHQNYCYEDFITGYKPDGEGFELKHGVFYDFCKKAADDKDNEYFFIIDEINRGNMSKIFGELLMLIESDYRGEHIVLAYEENDSFVVPENLYIIGMMNTADRSLAMIDYALRRRFSFFDMEPGFETDGFKKYQSNVNGIIGNNLFNNLIAKVIELNKAIESDKSLGKGFCIGHSYFSNDEEINYNEDWLKEIVEFDILPMLREYWFDDNDNYDKWVKEFKGVLNV